MFFIEKLYFYNEKIKETRLFELKKSIDITKKKYRLFVCINIRKIISNEVFEVLKLVNFVLSTHFLDIIVGFKSS